MTVWEVAWHLSLCQWLTGLCLSCLGVVFGVSLALTRPSPPSGWSLAGESIFSARATTFGKLVLVVLILLFFVLDGRVSATLWPFLQLALPLPS